MELKHLPWVEEVLVWDKAINALKPFDQSEFALWKLYKKSIAIMDSSDQTGWFTEEMKGHEPTNDMMWAMIVLQDDKLEMLRKGLQKVIEKSQAFMQSFRDEEYDWKKYETCSDIERVLMGVW